MSKIFMLKIFALYKPFTWVQLLRDENILHVQFWYSLASTKNLNDKVPKLLTVQCPQCIIVSTHHVRYMLVNVTASQDQHFIIKYILQQANSTLPFYCQVIRQGTVLTLISICRKISSDQFLTPETRRNT